MSLKNALAAATLSAAALACGHSRDSQSTTTTTGHEVNTELSKPSHQNMSPYQYQYRPPSKASAPTGTAVNQELSKPSHENMSPTVPGGAGDTPINRETAKPSRVNESPTVLPEEEGYDVDEAPLPHKDGGK